MVLQDDEHLGKTIISGNKDLSRNSITEIRYSFLSSLHIGIHTGDAKDRI